MTKRSILKFLGLMGVVGLAACDSMEVTEPTVRPQQDQVAYDWAPVTAPHATVTTTKVQVIGSGGGTIVNGANLLIVPALAVLTPTEFTFTMVGDGYLHASLSARSVLTGLPVSTFPRPLMLRMSYAGANVSNPSALFIAWVEDGTVDGSPQRQTSWVSTSMQTVTAYLWHFSDYVVFPLD